jgi:mycothiol synthase
MMASLIDERQLPAIPMVWPIERLPAVPQATLPGGYIGQACLESDRQAVLTLIAGEWPGKEEQDVFDDVLPGRAFLMIHAETGEPVATGIAKHVGGGRGDCPLVGAICYVVVNPVHRRKGLGSALTALAVAHLIEAGYRHIFLTINGWNLPAIRCYLQLGFVPLLIEDDLLPRWRKICNEIGWPVKEAEWPRSLAWAPPGAFGEQRALKKGMSFFRKFRHSILGRRVTFCYLVGNSLLLDIDRTPGDDSSGHVIWLNSVWQVWATGGVLVGSDFCLVQGEGDADVSEARGVTFDYMRSQRYPAAKYERAGALVGRLVGEPVTGLEVKPRSNALAVEVGGRFLVQTFLQVLTDWKSWSIDNRGRRVEVYGSLWGLKVVRTHRGEERPTSRVRRQKAELHALDDDGLVLCNPRDKEAARRAEMEGIATDDRATVTCRKCLALLYKRDKALREEQ